MADSAKLLATRALQSTALQSLEPHWLETLPDNASKRYLLQLYARVRAEQGDDVSALRDILIRRACYLDRLCNALEGMLEGALDDGPTDLLVRLQGQHLYAGALLSRVLAQLGLKRRSEKGTPASALAALRALDAGAKARGFGSMPGGAPRARAEDPDA